MVSYKGGSSLKKYYLILIVLLLIFTSIGSWLNRWEIVGTVEDGVKLFVYKENRWTGENIVEIYTPEGIIQMDLNTKKK